MSEKSKESKMSFLPNAAHFLSESVICIGRRKKFAGRRLFDR